MNETHFPPARGRLLALCAARAGLAALALPLAAWAAPVPDAGRSMRDIESVRPALPPAPAPELDLPSMPQPAAPAAAESGGAVAARLEVSGFRLDGNQAFGDDLLLPLLDDLKGKALTLAELRAAAGRLSAFYQERGYLLARAYLPPQDIEHGVVLIRVQEGRYGEVVLDNRSRTLDAAIRAPLSRLHPGDAVQGDALEQTLHLLADMPGIAVRGTLRPGTQPGATDLVVEAAPGPLVDGSLEADNYGSVYTGEYRLGGSLGINSPLRLGDRLDLRLLSSDTRQRYYRAGYQLPLGLYATRLGAASARTRYRLGRDFAELEAHGTADVHSAFLSQPLLRSSRLNLTAQLQYDHKRLRDDMDLFEVSSAKRLDALVLSLSGNADDDWLGGGRSVFYLGYASGRLRLGDPYDQARDAFTARSAGRYHKLNLSAARRLQLPGRFHFYAQFNAQLASRNLDSAEKLGLGGPYGVRAYTLGAGSGDQGWQASAELRYAPAPGWLLSAFIDEGAVAVNKHPWTPARNTLALGAAGLGLRWADESRQFTASLAWPLGKRELHEVPRREPRLWLQATQTF